MKRFLSCLVLLAIAQPAWAASADAPYYGPMKRRGIGSQIGYKDRTEKDGSWRIDAAIHGRSDAIDMALYRAAERAHELGYRYLFLLGGSGSKMPGLDMATVYARPSHEAVGPIGCRSKKVTSCYTADVMEVMRILGGPDGTQPGIPILARRDELGRDVFLSGYGTGAVASLVPGGRAQSYMTTVVENGSKDRRSAIASPNRTGVPALVIAPSVSPPHEIFAAPPRSYVPVDAGPRGPTDITPNERFERAMKAAQPVRGREPNQGWTISD